MLPRILACTPQVEPTSSRSECLFLLLEAVYPAGLKFTRPVLMEMKNLCAEDPFWRVNRAFRNAAILVNKPDQTLALEVAATIADEKYQRQTMN